MKWLLRGRVMFKQEHLNVGEAFGDSRRMAEGQFELLRAGGPHAYTLGGLAAASAAALSKSASSESVEAMMASTSSTCAFALRGSRETPPRASAACASKNICHMWYPVALGATIQGRRRWDRSIVSRQGSVDPVLSQAVSRH